LRGIGLCSKKHGAARFLFWIGVSSKAYILACVVLQEQLIALVLFYITCVFHFITYMRSVQPFSV